MIILYRFYTPVHVFTLGFGQRCFCGLLLLGRTVCFHVLHFPGVVVVIRFGCVGGNAQNGVHVYVMCAVRASLNARSKRLGVKMKCCK